MSSETLITLNAEIDSVRRKYLTLRGVRQTHLTRLDELQDEITTLHEDKTRLAKVDSLLEYLVRELSGSSIHVVEQLVSDGLTTILGKEYEFKIKVETKRGNLCFNPVLIEDGEEMDIMDSKGGGIVDLISVFLRIMTIKIMGLQPFLILDESLSQLSKDHIEKALDFIKEVCEKFGFTVLAVTHDERVSAAADKVYRVSKDGKIATVEEDNG